MVDGDKITLAIANRIKALIAAGSWGGYVLEEEPEDPSQHRRPSVGTFNMWTVDVGDPEFQMPVVLGPKSERPALIEYRWTHTIRYRYGRVGVARKTVMARLLAVCRDLISKPSLEDAALGGKITARIWQPPAVHELIDEQVDDDAIYYAQISVGFAQTESIVQS